MRFSLRLFAYAVVGSACHLLTPSIASATPPGNDQKLQRLTQDDQRDRTDIRGKPWNAEITERDRHRRQQVLELLRAGRIRSGTDFSNAALIFQHGDSADDIRMAYSLAWTAFTMLDDGEPKKRAGWLSAAAWDRLMVRLGKPQWYGTQYLRDPKTNRAGGLFPFDESALTKEERERFLKPPLR